MKTKTKIITFSSALILAALLTVGFVKIVQYMCRYGLNYTETVKVDYEKGEQWIIKNSEKVETTSFDGLKLKACFVKNSINSHKYGIFMHGYKDTPVKMEDYGHHFYDKGWNIIIPGQRGHSWSEGTFIDMGFFARKDVLSWINYINQQDSEAKILLYGVSMGAATVMMTTGLSLPENVLCAVEDCGYTSIWDQFSYRLKKEFGLPSFPFLTVAEKIAEQKYGMDFHSISPENQLPHSRTPTLFIHGTADDFVPYYMMDILFKAAACEKEKVSIPDAKHAKSIYENPELYWQSVDSFVEKYF